MRDLHLEKLINFLPKRLILNSKTKKSWLVWIDFLFPTPVSVHYIGVIWSFKPIMNGWDIWFLFDCKSSHPFKKPFSVIIHRRVVYVLSTEWQVKSAFRRLSWLKVSFSLRKNIYIYVFVVLGLSVSLNLALNAVEMSLLEYCVHFYFECLKLKSCWKFVTEFSNWKGIK